MKKINKFHIITFLAIFIPTFLCYKGLLLNKNLAQGDAPHFYNENFKELIYEPLAWVTRGQGLGGINKFLPLSPLMILIGVVQRIISLDSDNILRIFFYFPAIISSFAGAFIFAKHLKYSKKVQFFSSLLYGLNTYILLITDGGQVGVLLSYGIFPFEIIFLDRYLKKRNIVSFLLALVFSVILTVVDVRVSIIAFLTIFLWYIFRFLVQKNIKYLIKLSTLAPLIISVIGINLYWIYPLLKIGQVQLTESIASLKLTSILNGLLIYQPHWPLNQFGKISYPKFYFVIFPILVFGSIFTYKKRNKTLPLILLILVFIFLIKGETEPLGFIYTLIINKIPFGSTFRDSTKFFIPLILFSSILLGLTTEWLSKKYNNLKFIILVFVYFFILLTVKESILGKLNYVLGSSIKNTDYQLIYENLKNDFNRSVWIPEIPNLAFESQTNMAIDGRTLANIRPFASLNAGTDPFNFLNNKDFTKWFELFGIKYIFLPGNFRNIEQNSDEVKNWNEITNAISNAEDIKKLNWPTKFSVYETKNQMPTIFGSSKMFFLVGPDDITQTNTNTPIVYLEDGNITTDALPDYVATDSAIIVFNKKTDIDLQMALASKYFVNNNLAHGKWERRNDDNYLHAKYDLLINKIDTHEFFFQKGLYFSSVPEEHETYPIKIDKEGEYTVAIRYMDADSQASELYYQIGKKSGNLPKSKNNLFNWAIITQERFSKSTQLLDITNKNGFHVINAVAIIPQNEWNQSVKTVISLKKRFKTIYLDSDSQENSFKELIQKTTWEKLDSAKITPTSYSIKASSISNWIIFSDSYNKLWNLRRGQDYFPSYSIYSSINGFYIDSKWNDTEIVFVGQKNARWGIYFSLISLLSVTIIILFRYTNKENGKNKNG